MEQTIRLHCLACGTRVTLEPGARARGLARECLVCPVCRAVGAALDEALAAAAQTSASSDFGGPSRAVEPHQAPPTGKPDRECAPVTLGRSDEHRLLACVRPDGPELEGASREEKELARMLWRLAGE